MKREPLWMNPLDPVHLTKSEVHVWRASLEVEPDQVETYRTLLSGDERERSDKYRFMKDKKHFIVARGILRKLLSRYLKIDADTIEFTYSSHGKPALADKQNPNGICFNLSHSNELALFAFSCRRKTGVDVEYIKKIEDYEELIHQFFSDSERAQFRDIPLSSKQAAFYACWTRKEAFVKAKGQGLSIDTKRFSVSVHPEVACLLETDNDCSKTAGHWRTENIEPGTNYMASLVVEGHPWTLSRFNY